MTARWRWRLHRFTTAGGGGVGAFTAQVTGVGASTLTAGSGGAFAATVEGGGVGACTVTAGGGGAGFFNSIAGGCGGVGARAATGVGGFGFGTGIALTATRGAAVGAGLTFRFKSGPINLDRGADFGGTRTGRGAEARCPVACAGGPSESSTLKSMMTLGLPDVLLDCPNAAPVLAINAIAAASAAV